MLKKSRKKNNPNISLAAFSASSASCSHWCLTLSAFHLWNNTYKFFDNSSIPSSRKWKWKKKDEEKKEKQIEIFQLSRTCYHHPYLLCICDANTVLDHTFLDENRNSSFGKTEHETREKTIISLLLQLQAVSHRCFTNTKVYVRTTGVRLRSRKKRKYTSTVHQITSHDQKNWWKYFGNWNYLNSYKLQATERLHPTYMLHRLRPGPKCVQKRFSFYEIRNSYNCEILQLQGG